MPRVNQEVQSNGCCWEVISINFLWKVAYQREYRSIRTVGLKHSCIQQPVRRIIPQDAKNQNQSETVVMGPSLAKEYRDPSVTAQRYIYVQSCHMYAPSLPQSDHYFVFEGMRMILHIWYAALKPEAVTWTLVVKFSTWDYIIEEEGTLLGWPESSWSDNDRRHRNVQTRTSREWLMTAQRGRELSKAMRGNPTLGSAVSFFMTVNVLY